MTRQRHKGLPVSDLIKRTELRLHEFEINLDKRYNGLITKSELDNSQRRVEAVIHWMPHKLHKHYQNKLHYLRMKLRIDNRKKILPL